MEINNTIIVADDDAGARFILEKMLTADGYEVICAKNGAEVFAALEREHPLLFLLDVSMPEMDGLEVCRRLKADPRLYRVPVIFLTSHDQTSDLVRGFKSGAADYIGKPIRKEEVLARVNTHVRLYLYMLEMERLHQLALDANPSTGLPGNNSIAAAVSRAINFGGPTAILYCDLDNFKAFNDKYGFARGDEVIKFTADIIKESLEAMTDAESFLGHIGGDDFTILIASDQAEPLAQKIVQAFAAKVADFYDPEDARIGKILAKNRQGHTQEFPLMTISIGIVDLQGRSFRHYLEVAAACAEVKEVAKHLPGNSIFFDRRQAG